MTAEEIAKLILGVVLAIQIIGYIVSYKFIKNKTLNPLFYLLCTIVILCAFAFLCFDSKLFQAEHEAKFYYIELGVYLGIEIIGIIAFFVIKKVKKNLATKDNRD